MEPEAEGHGRRPPVRNLQRHRQAFLVECEALPRGVAVDVVHPAIVQAQF